VDIERYDALVGVGPVHQLVRARRKRGGARSERGLATLLAAAPVFKARQLLPPLRVCVPPSAHALV